MARIRVLNPSLDTAVLVRFGLNLLVIVLIGWAGTAHAAPALLPTPQEPDPNAPFVHLMADTVMHDDQRQIATAEGHVEFIYEERVLKAQRVDYDLARETVTAVGDVVLMDRNGDVHFADRLQLTRDMQEGYIQALQTTLADGSRFWAHEGHRKQGQVIVMREARYTPCTPCKTDPSRSPLWQLRANKVIHDNVAKTVSYQDAWMELAGVPVVYTPYFSHPDGSVKQKDGFLAPIMKLSSRNGANVTGRYYWGLDPWRDATLGVQAFTKQAPRVLGEYRERFDRGEVAAAASVTYSDRKDRDGTNTVVRDEKLRGHFETKARFDLNDYWRSGVNLNIASDEQYLRQYDVTTTDVLENEIYAERFDNRDYAVVRMMAFQDLRTSTRQVDQPNILPEAEAIFYGDPGSLLGGRWRWDASLLGLERGDGGDDMTRASTTASWNGRYVTGGGLVNTFDAMVRGDLYYALNRGTDSATEKNKSRLFPLAQWTMRYPLARPSDRGQWVLEPIAALTLVPRLDQDLDDIPNEDSQDIQLDASNLFESSRFPGLDRVEDLSRVTYGGRVMHQGERGDMVEVFLGQSYRFEQDATTPFPRNSGLADQQSDYVGRVKFNNAKGFIIDYGFQLDGRELESVRHEFDAGYSRDRWSLNTRYLYAKTIEGIGVDESREQIQSYASYRFLPDWQARLGANYDLGEDPGLRKTVMGLDYLGQCLTFSANIQRNLTSETSGESGSELTLRIGLKNLGEFQTSGIGLGSTNSDNERDANRGLPIN
jgi:LPS-assembly protein